MVSLETFGQDVGPAESTLHILALEGSLRAVLDDAEGELGSL